MEAVTSRCPFKYALFKIICEEVHFLVKLQTLELKHLKVNCFTFIFQVFFSKFLLEQSALRKNINSGFRLVQILRFGFTFNKLKTFATSTKVILIMILQQSIAVVD